MKRWDPTENKGVAAVTTACAEELGWIFRATPSSDVGVDGQIELVEGREATGKLIGVQIKTGASYLKKTARGLVYYGRQRDLDYWAEYSLPVIMVFHIPDEKFTFWVNIDDSSIARTSDGWNIVIPEENTFDQRCKGELKKIFKAGSNHLPLSRSYRASGESADSDNVLELANEVAKYLMLFLWEAWIERACSTYIVGLPEPFVDGVKVAKLLAMKSIIPEEYQRTKYAILNLIERASDLIDEFMPKAEYIQIQKSYHGLQDYKRFENPNYAQDRAEHEAWTMECVALVHELAKAANLFADVVREDLDRGFLRRRGRFLVSDDFQHGGFEPKYLRSQKSQILKEWSSRSRIRD